MYDKERLLIVPGTSKYFVRTWHISILSFFGYVEAGMYDQERLLIVPGTSQYFLIPSL